MPNNNLIELQNKLRELQKSIRRDIPVIVGKLAVDHFKNSFHQEGFLNNGLKKWEDVKRRQSASPWYGFEYTGQKRTSVRFVRSRKTGKTTRSKNQKKLNFSLTATTRKTLSSKRMELHNSIRYKASSGHVTIYTDKPYAKVHNEGGTIKVFGKHPAKVPQRQFMGESAELSNAIKLKIEEYLTNLLK